MKNGERTFNNVAQVNPIMIKWHAYRVSSLMFKRCHAVMGGGGTKP